MYHKIAVKWVETGVVLVKGKDLSEAIKKAEKIANNASYYLNVDGIQLPDGEYLDGSFQIDKKTTRLLNKRSF